MRCGFTTGSCAAAAAKAAAYMLLSGEELPTGHPIKPCGGEEGKLSGQLIKPCGGEEGKLSGQLIKPCGGEEEIPPGYPFMPYGRKEEIPEVTIETPSGTFYAARIEEIFRGKGWVRCAVRKDGGDDPDVTDGTLIEANVSFAEETPYGRKEETPSGHPFMPCGRKEEAPSGHPFMPCGRKEEAPSGHPFMPYGRKEETPLVRIDGGVGVGRVTKPGLDQPIGSAAINRVPRMMIEKEVLEVCREFGYRGVLEVVISVPEGEALAKRTFNPRLGIVGGISILGTSGIVEPMSSRAVLETIRLELRQRREQGQDGVVVSPGNYGLGFMRRAYGYDLEKSVKCGNFIGKTVDMAAELGFRRMLLAGHIGKLVKVAGGIMDTHSREGDCRMELLAAFAILEGAGERAARQVLECATTEEALQALEASGRRQAVMERTLERICYYLDRRAEGKIKIDCILYANEFGELAKTKEAGTWFTLSGRGPGRKT